MNKTRAFLLIATFALLGVGGTIKAYQYGEGKGYTKGQEVGYNKAPTPNYYKEDQYDILVNRLKIMEDNYNDMEDNYNDLVTDYNDLRAAAINYVGAAQYQTRQPLTCNTHNYSTLNSSSTTCY